MKYCRPSSPGLGEQCWVQLLLCAFISAFQKLLARLPIFALYTDVAFKFDVTKYAGYAIATLVGVAWYRERRARKSATQQTSGRVHELEAIIDPKRTSSGLNTDGSDPTGDVA